ncbi:hypothetical protein [Nocardioides stalactiti]|uniref:hypothetical protein n=1 Tax=Nocardioides stalactiti TaxID=2755356 RepID=UPI001600C0EE|nr:hypothetical protein [Nocardioides stalactiti]
MDTENRAPSTTPDRARVPVRSIVVTYVCVLLVGMGLAWAFLSMRAVAGVGGSCASGGAYEIATPCPDGSWLIAIAIPMMLIAMFAGSGFGMSVGAPALLLPMWALLFGSLGWNFLEFGVKDGVEIGFLVCGVMFWGMAAPAWWAMFVAFTNRIRGKSDPERNEKAAKERAAANVWSAGSLDGSLWWWAIYAVLGSAGAFFGVAIYALASA